MNKRMWKELRDDVVEDATDKLHLLVDLIAAPVTAICRVASDFIHGEGRYKHPDRRSRQTD
jgi:hypothetical protein